MYVCVGPGGVRGVGVVRRVCMRVCHGKCVWVWVRVCRCLCVIILCVVGCEMLECGCMHILQYLPFKKMFYSHVDADNVPCRKLVKFSGCSAIYNSSSYYYSRLKYGVPRQSVFALFE